MADSKGKAPMIHMMTTGHLKRAIAMDQNTTAHINNRLQADVIARTATTAHVAQALNSGAKQSGGGSGSPGQGSQAGQSTQGNQGGKKG